MPFQMRIQSHDQHRNADCQLRLSREAAINLTRDPAKDIVIVTVLVLA